MIRAVLDTDIWISASLTPYGVPGQIFKAWQAGLFDVVVSESILGELEEVFREKKIRGRMVWTAEEVTNFLLSLYEGSIVASGEAKLKAVREDPADDKFFIAAVEGDADCIVSGDNQVQRVREYQGIKVLSPAEFLKRLKLKERKKVRKKR